MLGMDWMQMSNQERFITISILSVILLIAFIIDRIKKQKEKKSNDRRRNY